MTPDSQSMTAFPQSPVVLPEPTKPQAQTRPPRRWRHKFGAAFRGLKLGIRGHSSFFVHFFFTALVLAAGIILGCELLEWCILLLCIGLVLTTELINSAVETLFRGLDETTKQRVWPCLDISAGAVLLASLVASIVGTIVFLHRLSNIF